MKKIVTIGGGLAGIEVSAILASFGYDVTVVEKTSETGGKINQWDHLFPNLKPASEVKNYLDEKITNNGFKVLTSTEITEVNQHHGKFNLKTNQGADLQSDAVVIATGFEVFDAKRKEEYGYNIYDNVITSVELEQMFKSGNPITTKNGKTPKRIALIHCVGSRDEKSGNHYCSKVCCVTGVKQAIELNELLPNSEVFCFYMDLRMYNQHYEELYRKAQEKHGIQFIRGRLSEASENIDETLLIKAEDTLSGRPLKMTVDMIVLLVGMEPGKGTAKIAQLFDLEKDESGFITEKDLHLHSNITAKNGVFLAGACACPMNITDTIENARSAALEVHNYLIRST